jgi:6-oxo-cyclohex-1-ene-carbonyl-CoA hydrolase
MRLGLLNDVVPVHKNAEGKFVPNPTVITDRYVDEMGRIVYGDWKAGAEGEAAKAAAKALTIDLSNLDTCVDRLATKLLNTFPDCTRKTLESLRKKKLEHWFQNMESSRSWLSLNMNTEAAAGFSAFHYGDRNEREIDFSLLRKRLAEGVIFDDKLVEEVLPPSARAARKKDRG